MLITFFLTIFVTQNQLTKQYSYKKRAFTGLFFFVENFFFWPKKAALRFLSKTNIVYFPKKYYLLVVKIYRALFFLIIILPFERTLLELLKSNLQFWRPPFRQFRFLYMLSKNLFYYLYGLFSPFQYLVSIAIKFDRFLKKHVYKCCFINFLLKKCYISKVV